MYSSLRQARYMHAAAERGEIKPSVVKEFDTATRGRLGHLSEKAASRAHGGEACLHCGGTGYAQGGEAMPEEASVRTERLGQALRSRRFRREE